MPPAEGVTEQRAFSHMQAVVGPIALAVRGRQRGFLGRAIAGGIITTADLGKPPRESSRLARGETAPVRRRWPWGSRLAQD